MKVGRNIDSTELIICTLFKYLKILKLRPILIFVHRGKARKILTQSAGIRMIIMFFESHEEIKYNLYTRFFKNQLQTLCILNYMSVLASNCLFLYYLGHNMWNNNTICRIIQASECCLFTSVYHKPFLCKLTFAN